MGCGALFNFLSLTLVAYFLFHIMQTLATCPPHPYMARLIILKQWSVKQLVFDPKTGPVPVEGVVQVCMFNAAELCSLSCLPWPLTPRPCGLLPSHCSLPSKEGKECG